MAIDKEEFNSYLESWQAPLATLNALIGQTEYWNVSELAEPHKSDFDRLACEIGEAYLASSQRQAKRIRDLLAQYTTVLLTLTYSINLEDIKTKEDYPLLRRLVAFESIVDQYTDWRESVIYFAELREVGLRAGIDLDRLRQEVVRVSSTRKKSSMGSMRDIINDQFDRQE